MLDLYHEDDNDSRGLYACQTDNTRPRRVVAANKWEEVFVRCRTQVIRIAVKSSIGTLHVIIVQFVL